MLKCASLAQKRIIGCAFLSVWEFSTVFAIWIKFVLMFQLERIVGTEAANKMLDLKKIPKKDVFVICWKLKWMLGKGLHNSSDKEINMLSTSYSPCSNYYPLSIPSKTKRINGIWCGPDPDLDPWPHTKPNELTWEEWVDL